MMVVAAEDVTAAASGAVSKLDEIAGRLPAELAAVAASSIQKAAAGAGKVAAESVAAAVGDAAAAARRAAADADKTARAIEGAAAQVRQVQQWGLIAGAAGGSVVAAVIIAAGWWFAADARADAEAVQRATAAAQAALSRSGVVQPCPDLPGRYCMLIADSYRSAGGTVAVLR